jgi:HlyD family secretion protein
LSKKEFVSEAELRDAKLAVEIAEAKVKSARQALLRYKADLANADHELDEVRITAEMSGFITALNVEEGESAIIGTMNNPGTVLLTIADLSEMEAEVRVDETEVVFIEPGQMANVTLDAFPDTSFAGMVTEVGNSAIRGQLGVGQESVDFKVVVAILDSIPNIRPGLSASVDVTVAEKEDVLAVPIQCLTVRDSETLARWQRKGRETEDPDTGGEEPDSEDARDIEGVFVVEDGSARFRPVVVGIAGEKYFEIVSGLKEDERVVTGPFNAIGDLRDGDRVKVEKQRSADR